MPHLKKSRRFCSAKVQSKYKNVIDATHRRWSSSPRTTVDHDCVDTVNQDCLLNTNSVTQDSEQNNNAMHNKIIDAVNHDHNYVKNSEMLNKHDMSLDIHEEEVNLSPPLPKSAIPIDSYRLVIELGHIIKQLKAGCTMCQIPLNICSAKGVLPRGLGGWIYITCDNPACFIMNKISMGKQHKKTVSNKDCSTRGYAIFDVNTKAASGMLHVGIGEAGLNNLLSTMNMSQITHRILKVREVEIGSVIETFANKSVNAALLKEQALTKKDLNIDGTVGIEVSSDAAWQKRGSQRSYNSLSGIASTIGKRTQKIVHYNARYKRCRICWYAEKQQSP